MQRESAVQYSDWFNSYPWEVMLTVRLPRSLPTHRAYKLIVADVLRPLAIHLKTQVASVMVTVPGTPQESPHCHALLLSKGGELFLAAPEALAHLRSLRNIIITHDAAVEISPILNRGGSEYVAGHIAANTEINFFNKQLLANRRNHGPIQAHQ